MKFDKYHALGNDYLVIDPEALPAPLTPPQVQRVCHRHFGIGSDGILLGPLPTTRVLRLVSTVVIGSNVCSGIPTVVQWDPPTGRRRLEIASVGVPARHSRASTSPCRGSTRTATTGEIPRVSAGMNCRLSARCSTAATPGSSSRPEVRRTATATRTAMRRRSNRCRIATLGNPPNP